MKYNGLHAVPAMIRRLLMLQNIGVSNVIRNKIIIVRTDDMEKHEVIQQIKLALAVLQNTGQYFVHIPSLMQFLGALEKDASQSAEARKLQHESNLEWYKAQRQYDLEMFKSVIQTGQTALKTCFLVNGGAAVALLAFIGNIWTKTQTPAVAKALTLSLSLFGVGVLLAGFATGTTYLAQAAFTSSQQKTGKGFQVSTIILVLLGYVAFGFGVWSAYRAFISQLVP